MPNVLNRKTIIEQLKSMDDREMMLREVEKLLDKELSKPAEEIDEQMVKELLDLMNVPQPAQEDMDAAWQSIEAKASAQRKANWKPLALRCAIAAAAIVMIFTITLQTAEAFRWTFLLKLLSPVAQTFGIHSLNNPSAQDQLLTEVYTDAPTDYLQVNYSSIEDMPAQLHGVRVLPTWMPEGYTFVQGSVHQEPSVTTVFWVYVCEDASIFLNANIFLTEEAVSGYEFEQSIQAYDVQPIAGQQVTFYRNNEGKIESYSWITANTHYALCGKISVEELTRIIEGLLA